MRDRSILTFDTSFYHKCTIRIEKKQKFGNGEELIHALKHTSEYKL